MEILEITFEEFEILSKEESLQLIDVRELEEREMGHIGGLHIPSHAILSRLSDLDPTKTTVCYCRSGKRSYLAAMQIAAHFKNNKVYSLKGGIYAIPF